jgi:hypothetical protein
MDLTGINENGTELELDLSELEWIVLGRNWLELTRAARNEMEWNEIKWNWLDLIWSDLIWLDLIWVYWIGHNGINWNGIEGTGMEPIRIDLTWPELT